MSPSNVLYTCGGNSELFHYHVYYLGLHFSKSTKESKEQLVSLYYGFKRILIIHQGSRMNLTCISVSGYENSMIVAT